MKKKNQNKETAPQIETNTHTEYANGNTDVNV